MPVSKSQHRTVVAHFKYIVGHYKSVNWTGCDEHRESINRHSVTDTLILQKKHCHTDTHFTGCDAHCEHRESINSK